jgi:hypothetical protein
VRAALPEDLQVGVSIEYAFGWRTQSEVLLLERVPERVAMKVTGHRTRAVFDRDHIVSRTDLQDVAARLTGTLTGTIAPRAASGHLTPVS